MGYPSPARLYYSQRHGMYPPAFRPPHGIQRKPVPGGRWEVRRSFGKQPWHAHSRGAARAFVRSFQTQAEAVAWAQRVAQAWKRKDGNALMDLVFEKRPSLQHQTLSVHKVLELCERYGINERWLQ